MTDNNFAEQPDEIGALRKLIGEFMSKWKGLENEIELLRQDQKDLKEEYADQLDIKTLNAAIKVLKIEAAIQHRDTYDTMVEALKDEGV